MATLSDTVFVIQAECGDYYCGCGGGHICAIATSPEEAERLESELATHTSYGRRKWIHGFRRRKLPLDTALDGSR